MKNKNCINCLHFGGKKGVGYYYCNYRNKSYRSVVACGDWLQRPEPCTPAPEPERTTQQPLPSFIIHKALMESAMHGIISHDEYQRAMNWLHELTTPAEEGCST